MDLSDKELADLKDYFDMLDHDKEGCLQAKDLSSFMRGLGRNPTDSQLQAMINELDMDGTGSINFSEFTTAIMNRLTTEHEEEDLREAFNVYDRDNQGYIGIDQLRKVMMALNLRPTDEELDEILHYGDEDGDGVINYEDFVTVMSPR